MSGSKDFAATVSFDEDLSNKNVKELMSDVQTKPMTAFIDDVELNALPELRENSELWTSELCQIHAQMASV